MHTCNEGGETLLARQNYCTKDTTESCTKFLFEKILTVRRTDMFNGIEVNFNFLRTHNAWALKRILDAQL